MDDMGAKLESDRDYRKVTRSGEFGRSGSAPNLVPQDVHFFGGADEAGAVQQSMAPQARPHTIAW